MFINNKLSQFSSIYDGYHRIVPEDIAVTIALSIMFEVSLIE